MSFHQNKVPQASSLQEKHEIYSSAGKFTALIMTQKLPVTKGQTKLALNLRGDNLKFSRTLHSHILNVMRLKLFVQVHIHICMCKQN